MLKSPYHSRHHSRLLAALAVATAVTLSAGSALAALANGDYVGKTEAEITKSLEQQGYKVEEVAEEDGKLEAEVSLEGKPYEIFTDPKTGKVVEIIEGDEDGDNEGSFLKRLFGIGGD